jgi:exopolysaccharide biosynthesis polyprenyl glycosylphosphotransferase
MSGRTGTRAEPGAVPTQPDAVPALAGVGTEQSFPAGPSTAQARSGEVDANFRRDQIFRRALFLADATAFLAAVALVSAVTSRPLRITWVSVCGLFVLCLGAKVFGLYDRDEALLRKTTLDEAPKLMQVATLGALGAWLAGGFVLGGGTLSRGDALLLWVSLIVFLVLFRAAARALALRTASAERCIFIGDRATAATIESKLTGHHGVKAELVAQVDPADALAWSTDAFSAPRLSEIRQLAQDLNAQRAVIAPDSLEPDRLLDLICTLKAVGIKVSVLPRLLEVVGSSVEFDDLHGVTLMGIKRFALTRSSAIVKRAFDLAGALFGLLAVAPVMIAMAIAIKLDSRGPVFFKQRRVGRYGEHFAVFKFRTMVPDADALKDSLRDRNEAQEGLFKIVDDPRVTRAGRFLRKTSLDELPQLLNVVRGEMSLVGPRPLVVDEDCHVTGWYRRRLELMPGMTGPWQILGPARVPLREMGAIDYLYVANWSLWSDVKILLRTVPHVLARRGL